MTKRMDKLLSLIPPCNVLADVGCDHGYIGIEALQSGKARRVLFVDVSLPSLNKARANLPPEWTDKAQFVCQNGLGALVCDAAVIAGMGGLEIISILSSAKNPPHALVLQPNRNARDVREYLNKGYQTLFDGKLLDGGKFYDMIVAELSEDPTPLTEAELEFGKTNITDPNEDFRLFLSKERSTLTKILQGCNDAQVQHKLALVDSAIASIGGKL